MIKNCLNAISNSKVRVATCAGIGLIGAALTVKYVANKISEHIADSIILALSFDNKKLAPDELKKKVRLVLIRKKVLEKLNGQLGAIPPLQGRVERAICQVATRHLSPLSGAENLLPLRKEFFNKTDVPVGRLELLCLNIFFRVVDFFRKKLPGEDLKIGYFDQFVINKSVDAIIDSIKLDRKPTAQWTFLEKTLEPFRQAQRIAIFKKVESKIAQGIDQNSGAMQRKYVRIGHFIDIVRELENRKRPSLKKLFKYAAGVR